MSAARYFLIVSEADGSNDKSNALGFSELGVALKAAVDGLRSLLADQLVSGLPVGGINIGIHDQCGRLINTIRPQDVFQLRQ